MSFVIAIPTYKRVDICSNQTLSTLEREGISKDIIYVFVVEEEYDIYREKLGEEYKIIIGELGLINQKNFIENYFPIGQHILFLDDDIKEIDLCGKSLKEFIEEAFEECIKQKAFIFSIYPVWNKFYRRDKPYLTTCLNMCIGAFYGIINRRDKDLLLTLPNDDRDDIERSILYFKKDKIVLRYNQYGYNTKFYNSIGGLGGMKERIERIEIAVNYLQSTYPTFGKIKVRKSDNKKGIIEFVLNKIKAEVINSIDKQITILPSCIGKYDKLYEMLNQITIPNKTKSNNRLDFPRYRGCVFGIVRQRFSGKVELSNMSKKYPLVYEEILNIGKDICPFEFKTIQLNKNLVCPKHKDKNNNGFSLLVSFGEYTGCNIVIEGEKYDAKDTPIIFNGSILEHENTNDLIGNKYSLVFFN
jgi:hypothetical protein